MQYQPSYAPPNDAMNRPSKHVLFYSMHCPYSKQVCEKIHVNGVASIFMGVNVDTNRSEIPNFVTAVPTILTIDRRLLVDDEVFSFVDQMSSHRQPEQYHRSHEVFSHESQSQNQTQNQSQLNQPQLNQHQLNQLNQLNQPQQLQPQQPLQPNADELTGVGASLFGRGAFSDNFGIVDTCTEQFSMDEYNTFEPFVQEASQESTQQNKDSMRQPKFDPALMERYQQMRGSDDEAFRKNRNMVQGIA